MVTLVGQVSRFLKDEAGDTIGLIMEDGQEVRLPVGHGHLAALIVAVGAHVRVEGERIRTDGTGDCLDAKRITNLDSNRSTFLAPKCQEHRGMLSDVCPHTAASLVQAELYEEPREESGGVTNSEAATNIQRAYDRLHRVQAILAYLHILKRQVPGVSQFLDEAKHTYEQALSGYEQRDFRAALEFSTASACLSHVVQIVIARTLRADSSLPSLVPPPPNSVASGEPSLIEEQLQRTRSLLIRVHELLQRSTLPLEDRCQVRKIASWGDALYRQAQRMYHTAALPDAAELVHAALAGARSAEHLARHWHKNAHRGVADTHTHASQRI